MKCFSATLSLALFFALTACGGGSSSNSGDNAATNSAAEASAAPVATDSTSGIVAIPSDLKCGAVNPVWVNTNSKVYHESSDPYYGKTKHGQYMCPAAAVKEGYHKSGSRS